MDHDIIPEELDDLLSDIHDLIDEKEDLPEPEETASEFVLPDYLEAEMPQPEPEPEPKPEENFQQQRWTDRQKVPKHVAKLQHNQEEAYAQWLQEQEGKTCEPPCELPEEKPRHKRREKTDADTETPLPGQKKKHPALWICLTAVALTLLVAVLVAGFLPAQPRAESDSVRIRGASTVLLAGVDETLAHTDMLMLLSMDTRHHKLSIVSIPRDTVVETQDGSVALGSVYGRAGGGSEGVQALKEAVCGCIGIMPDGCMVFQPQTLTELADALGGVSFDLAADVTLGDQTLEAGTEVLTGREAYALMCLLEEGETLDLSRIRNQQRLLASVIRQCTDLQGVFKAPQLLDILTGTTVTDMNTRNLLWLARSALTIDKSSIYTATLPGGSDGSAYVLDADLVLQTVNAYCNPYIHAVSLEDLEITQR